MQGAAASPKSTSLEVLRHPIRVRIVEACNVYGRLSPIEIVNRGIAADLDSVRSKSHRQQLSHVAYHCRELEKAGLLEVSERPVRGATEHHYRPAGQAYFSDEEWAELTPHERCQISKVMWQHFIAQVENAMLEHTFDARTDRWLAWRPLELDERGWEEAAVAVAGHYAEIEQIRRDAEERLKASGEDPVRATWAVFSFESPTR
jgi:hypothetical protein